MAVVLGVAELGWSLKCRVKRKAGYVVIMPDKNLLKPKLMHIIWTLSFSNRKTGYGSLKNTIVPVFTHVKYYHNIKDMLVI